ncbi:MAG: DUF2157 domain-containing protein [Planctomycetia bacterium]|nr:DUF2157 domain-containing protein [Planctomycetia bacterium]
MPARQISDSKRRWLDKELVDWSRQGLITPEQAAKIRGLYETDDEAGARKQSKLSFALMSLAAFLVGLALFLVIGHNWDAIPRATKLLIIFGSLVGIHAAGLWLRFTKQAPRASELVFFLGCLFFGAGIWLVAQVFHLDAHYPDAFWWWAVGVLPFALCLDTMLLHLLLIGLLGSWAGMEIIGFSNLGSRLFWGWWTIPNGAYSLPLLALPGLAWCYRRGSSTTVGFYVPLFAWWIFLQAFAWDLEWQTVYFIGTLGALLLIIAETHRPGSKFAIPYRFWGVALLAGTLIPLSYSDFYRHVLRSSWFSYRDQAMMGVLAPFAAIAVLIATTLLISAWFYHAKEPARSGRERFMELLKRQWVPVGQAAGMAVMSLGAVTAAASASGRRVFDDDVVDWGLMILANVAMVSLALWLMRIGLTEDRGRPFTIGVMYFLLWAILRYIDLFAEAGGMLGAALMFFLCGAALAGVGLFWRKRKQVQHV